MDWSFLGMMVVGVASAAGIAYLLVIRKNAAQARRHLPTGAQLRIKSQGGVYRSRLLSIQPDHWVISAPLSRDNYVPLRESESVTVEAATAHGVMVLRSTIHVRDDDSHEFWLSIPEEVSYFDRRSSHRVSYGNGVNIEVDGSDAVLLDVSERGVKFRSWREFTKGERIHIQLPWDDEPNSAWVLDGTMHHAGDRGTNEYRAIFEELVEPKELKLPQTGQAK